MSSLRHVTALLAVAAIAGAASAACNAITGTGKYDLVDCPSGACGDGGSNGIAPSGPGSDAASSPPTDDSGMDAATAPVVDCGPGTAPVTLTVMGAAGSVSAKSGGSLSVSSGSTQTACLVTDTVEMRTSGPSADWTGPNCKDGNNGTDRCEFGVPAKGISITAALR